MEARLELLTGYDIQECAAPMGCFSQEIPVNMGPIFCKNIPKHGFVFSKISQIFKKWTHILRKMPKKGYLFLPKWPLKMGRGFEAEAAHPCPNQIWVSPPPTPCIAIYMSLGKIHLCFKPTEIQSEMLKMDENDDFSAYNFVHVWSWWNTNSNTLPPKHLK